MTAAPRDLARKRPAQVTRQVLDGEAYPTRPVTRTSGAGAFGWFAMFLLLLLAAGFALSMWQQAS